MSWMARQMPWFCATLWLGAFAGASFAAQKELVPPFELQWGGTPDSVVNLLSRVMRPISDVPISPPPAAQPGGSPVVEPAGMMGLFLSEQQYEGEIFAAKADRITPLFFMSQLFGLMASFPPSPEGPAALVWERIVEQVIRQYGAPRFRSKPVPLLSWNAVLQVVPSEANKSALLKIYNEADRDPQIGRYVLYDLQVQTGLWVPEATWRFPGGGAIKVVMRAGGRNEFGLMAIKPLLVILKHDMFP